MKQVSKGIKIRGERWNIRVLPTEIFFDQYGSDCAAITLLETKSIEIPVHQINFVTILHEIFHAYASYLHLASAEIDINAVEEIYAELFSSYGIQMINSALSLTESLGKSLKIPERDLLAPLSEDQRVSLLLKSSRFQKRRRKRT